MLKNKKILILACILFTITEIILSTKIQVSPGINIRAYSFATVILACVFCLISAEFSASYFLTQFALLATVGADYFLICLTPRQQLNGMICFSVVQIAYFLRIYLEETSNKRRKIHLIARATITVVALIATCIVLKDNTDTLSLVSLFYYANLIMNVIFAIAHTKRSLVLIVGLICFVICDTFIGLANIGPYLTIDENSLIFELLNPGFDPAWAFYVPSQTLLAMSVLPKRFKKS